MFSLHLAWVYYAGTPIENVVCCFYKAIIIVTSSMEFGFCKLTGTITHRLFTKQNVRSIQFVCIGSGMGASKIKD